MRRRPESGPPLRFPRRARARPPRACAGHDRAPPRPRPARISRCARFEHLPHIRIEHDLTEAEKTCSCCGASKVRIGEDESRELEFIPARLEVRVHVLPKYACSKCRDGVASPPVPPKPTPGGIAGPGLAAFVVVSKFADHLPLYRLEDILTRHGVHLSRSTLCDWVRDAAVVLEPLAALQRDLVLLSPVIWTDDTPVTVLGGDEPGSTTGRFWAYIGDDEHPYTVYDFTMSRSRDGPAVFLRDDKGFLQADAYGGYDGIFLASDGGIVEVACWVHAGLEFDDARFECAGGGQRDPGVDPPALRHRGPGAGSVGRGAAGAAAAGVGADPQSDRGEVDELTGQALPKSVLGKAVTYVRNQWTALRRYTSDGRLTIDNNVSERTLRLQAIGRNNWQFVGSAGAGSRAAVLFTILAGAKRHHLEPWAYVRDVLLRLSAGETDLESLLAGPVGGEPSGARAAAPAGRGAAACGAVEARREHRRAKARPKA